MASQGSEENKEKRHDPNKESDSLLDYINFLTANLQQVKHGFTKDSAGSNKPKVVYGYLSKTVETFVNPSLLKGSKLPRRRNNSNAMTAQYAYISSPNGTHSYQVKNISGYNEDTDPEIYPLRIFKIQLSDVNLSNGTFNASKAQVLTHKELGNMTSTDVTNFPTLHGKVTYDSKGLLAIQPYEQVKSGNNGYRVIT